MSIEGEVREKKKKEEEGKVKEEPCIPFHRAAWSKFSRWLAKKEESEARRGREEEEEEEEEPFAHKDCLPGKFRTEWGIP